MPNTVRLMVRGTKEGFRALRSCNAFEAPFNLRLLYEWMPTWFAASYWRRTLPTEVGQLGFAAHADVARDEMTVLARDVLRLLRPSSVAVPSLVELL